MFRKAILIAITVLLSSISLFAFDYEEIYFKVPNLGKEYIQQINELCSVDKYDDNFIYCYANPKQFITVQSKDNNIQILTNPSDIFEAPMAFTPEEVREWDSYPSYDAYVQMMYDFQTNYPDLCTTESFGQSVDNRELLVVKISDNVNIDEAEPEFFYSGQMHGDELVCSVLFLRLIDYLLSNYETDQDIQNIVNSTEIFINPISNPDGVYTNNNNTVNGATRYNANGVDLNRNFPSINGEQNPDGNATQIENTHMMNFANQHHFTFSSNSHSGAEVINYPWDTWERTHADDEWLEYLSRIYADTVHGYAPDGYMDYLDNGVTNGYQWYTTSGNRQDWFTHFMKCREITIELSDEKLLPASQLNDHWDYNVESMLEWIRQVNYGISGTITDSEGNPLHAKIEILNHDIDESFIFSEEETGYYHRLIYEGTYDIEISCDGYVGQIIENVQVNNNELLSLDVVLENANVITVSGSIIDNETNEAIEGALISFNSINSYTTTSDENGNFNIEEIYEGNYDFTIVKSGYQTYFENIVLEEGNNSFDISLNLSSVIGFEEGIPQEWTSSSNTPWLISDIAYEGLSSIKSGAIGNQSESNISLSINVLQTSEINFFYKVSSESDYDFLKFYIDGDLQDEWSGEIDWTNYSQLVQAGNHTFTWSYEKDWSEEDGSDCAYIDAVELPITEITPNYDGETVDPVNFNLSCYPNPFNPELTIRYNNTTKDVHTSISIFNVKGQLVKTFSTKVSQKGYNSLVWNGLDNNNKKVSTGIYFVKVGNNQNSEMQKVLLLK